MPSNTSAATATVIGAFPFSETVDPGDAGAGTAHHLWYKIPSALVDRVISYYSWTSYQTAGNLYLPDPYLWTGDDPGSLVRDDNLGFGIFDISPVQFVAQAGVTYWIDIKDDDNWDPGDQVTITVTRAADPIAYAPIGSIFIPSDQENTVNVILDQDTGDVIRAFGNLPPGETGAVLPDGTMMLENSLTHTLEIYTGQLEFVASVARPTMGSALNHTPVSHDGVRFYAAGYTQNLGPNTLTVRISAISATGSIEDTWTFTLTNSDSISAIAVTQDGLETLYLPRPSMANGIQRYDLGNDVPLSDFIAPGFYASGSFKEIFSLEDGTILVGSLLTSTTSVVRHFDASATLLMEYDGGNVMDHFHPGGTDDTLVIWQQSRPTNATAYTVSTFLTYRVSDGTLLNTSPDVQTFHTGIGWSGFEVTPNFPETPYSLFSNESSCPLLITRVALGEAPNPPDIDGTLGPIAWMEWTRLIP